MQHLSSLVSCTCLPDFGRLSSYHRRLSDPGTLPHLMPSDVFSVRWQLWIVGFFLSPWLVHLFSFWAPTFLPQARVYNYLCWALYHIVPRLSVVLCETFCRGHVRRSSKCVASWSVRGSLWSGCHGVWHIHRFGATGAAFHSCFSCTIPVRARLSRRRCRRLDSRVLDFGRLS